MMMNARERVLTAINHEEPDKVPSFELSIDNLKICNHFGEEYVFQGLIESFQKTYDLCNGDIETLTSTILKATETRSYLKNTLKKQLDLYTKIGIDMATIPYTGYILFPKKCFKDYFIDEYGRIFDLKKNPTDGMDIAYYKSGYFNNFEEYTEFEQPKADDPRRKKYFKAMKKIEKTYNGKVFVIPSIWGIFESTWQSFGFTNFSKLLISEHKLERVFSDRGQFAVDLVRTFIKWGEDGMILIYDDYGYKAGLQMNPKKFRQYVLPWIEKICSIAHENGIKIILHSCGDIFPIFKDIVEIGVDAVHPIEPTTANPKYDIFKLYQQYGEELTFIGNISPQALANKSSEYIREHAKKLINTLGPDGGYLLSSGHSINPAVKVENFLAMYETLEEYGTYPIH
jgi:uroporphyrinogen decarboxylase